MIPKTNILSANTVNVNLPAHLLVCEVALATIRWTGILLCVYIASQTATDIARTLTG